MARGIEIPLSLDPRKVLRGLKLTERGFEDLQDEIKDTERVSDRESDQIRRNMEDSAKRSERAFSDFGRSARDDFERMERAARESGRKIDRNLSDDIEGGTFRANLRTLAVETGQEFVEAWGEAVRSGNPAEVLREIGSNLLAIGAATGSPILAAAGGIASLFITTFIDRSAAENERLATVTQNISDAILTAFNQSDATKTGAEWYQAIITGIADEQAKTQNLQDVFGTETLAEAINEAQQLADILGLPYQVVVDGLAGQKNGVDALLGTYFNVSSELDAINTRIDNGTSKAEGTLAADLARKTALEGQKAALDRIVPDVSAAEQATKNSASAAQTLADNEARTASEAQEFHRFQNRAAVDTKNLATDTGKVKSNVENTPDLDIKANVDDSEIRNLPTRRDLFVTARVSAVGASSKAQNLLDRGII